MPEGCNRQVEVDFLIDAVANALNGKNYSEKYHRSLCNALQKISDYAAETGQKIYDPKLGQDFLRAYYSERRSQCRLATERAVNMLYDYFNYGKLLRRTKSPEDVWSGAMAEYFAEYYAYYKTLGMSDSSLVQTRRSLTALMRHLEAEGVMDITDIDTYHLYDLIGNRFVQCNKKDKNRVLRDVRKFLEYLHTQGTETKVFEHAFPHVRAFDESSGIPNVFTKEEVTRLLAKVDRGSPIGKRDYAILLIASRYGMRASDIRELKFSNFNWQEETLSIVQSKTGEPLVLPLFEDVGWSVIDYLDHGRPVTSCQHIFVIHNAPYDRFVGCMNHLVGKYMRMAKIPIKPHRKPGIHAFRHSLASEMLRGGVPISSIKEVLGQASIETTSKYQRIDLGQLALCALEVPYVTR